MSTRATAVWDLTVAIGLAIGIGVVESPAAGAIALVALVAAALIEIVATGPRRQHGPSEQLLSKWDFIGAPFTFVGAALAWYLLFEASAAGAAGFATVLTACVVFDDARSRTNAAADRKVDERAAAQQRAREA